MTIAGRTEGLKTFLKVLAVLVGIAVVIALLIVVKLKRNYAATLPIEGVVTDATTGKPIEKVIVSAVWHFSRFAVVDSQSWTKGHLAVTDADGRFRIPPVQTNGIISHFNYQTLFLNHPLFASKEQYVFREGEGYETGKVEGGVVKIELALLSLEERYARPDDNSDLASFFDAIRPEFYLFLRDKYGVLYDLKAILHKWEFLANRYPQGTYKSGYFQVQMYFRDLKFKMEKVIASY